MTEFSVEDEFDHLYSENDSTHLIGVREDGVVEYYESSTHSVKGRRSVKFFDVFEDRKPPEEFQEELSDDETFGDYLDDVTGEIVWADLTEWAKNQR